MQKFENREQTTHTIKLITNPKRTDNGKDSIVIINTATKQDVYSININPEQSLGIVASFHQFMRNGSSVSSFIDFVNTEYLKELVES